MMGARRILLTLLVLVALVAPPLAVVFGAASYPTSVKTFTTKSSGETIQAAHVNDLQDEVNAIETGLLNGLAHEVLVSLGTITTDKSILEGTATWNAGAVTFSAIKVNVTDTASAAASKLIDLQVGGASRFSVTKGGTLTVTEVLTATGNGSLGTPGIGIGGGVAGLAIESANTVTLIAGAVEILRGIKDVGGGGFHGFRIGGDPDVLIARGADNQLDFYNDGNIGGSLRVAADGETALLVRRNVGGTFTLQRVSMGAADSCSTGFKCLRVPN